MQYNHGIRICTEFKSQIQHCILLFSLVDGQEFALKQVISRPILHLYKASVQHLFCKVGGSVMRILVKVKNFYKKFPNKCAPQSERGPADLKRLLVWLQQTETVQVEFTTPQGPFSSSDFNQCISKILLVCILFISWLLLSQLCKNKYFCSTTFALQKYFELFYAHL